MANNSIECPVDFVSINENKARLTAASVFVLTVIFIFFQFKLIPLFLMLDFFVRAFKLGQYSPLNKLSDNLVATFSIKNKPVDQAPKRFAAKIGLLFSIAIALTLAIDLKTLSTILAIILAAFALLDQPLVFVPDAMYTGFIQNALPITYKQNIMTRIPPIDLNTISATTKIALEKHSSEYNEPVSNMQATLGHSLLAYTVYMQWDTLYKAVEDILGKRLACLFAYAISKESECSYCSVKFRKKIIDGGEDPEFLSLSAEEKNIVDFGSAITRCSGNIANHVYNSVASQYNQKEMVILIAFTGQMIAANIFNNVAETVLDEDLQKYIPVAKSIWQ